MKKTGLLFLFIPIIVTCLYAELIPLTPEEEAFVPLEDFFVSFSIVGYGESVRRIKMYFDDEDISSDLRITGSTISVVVMIGAILLAGIVVNNAIVLIDLINKLRAKGMSKLEAIMEGGSLRLRPIMMTTITTTLGLLPLAIGVGEGAEIRAPMAITVIGGLTVSTLLTLVVIPVVYSALDRKA